MRVWASAPDSVDTAAFVDALSPHALALEWVKHAADARIWIVDGAAPTTLARVQYLAVQPVPAVAYLGERMDALPHPGWALFKTPVKPLLVAHWLLLHGLVNRAPASPAPTVPAPAPTAPSSTSPYDDWVSACSTSAGVNGRARMSLR